MKGKSRSQTNNLLRRTKRGHRSCSQEGWYDLCQHQRSMTFEPEKLKLGREKVAKFEKATESNPDDVWSVDVYREGNDKVVKPVWE